MNRRWERARTIGLVVTDLIFAPLGFLAALLMVGAGGNAAAGDGAGAGEFMGARLGDLARFAADLAGSPPTPMETLAMWGIPALFLWATLHAFGQYEQRRWFRPPGVALPMLEVVAVFHGLMLAALLLAGVADRVPTTLLLAQAISITMALGLGRVVFRRAWSALRDAARLDTAVVAVVGTDPFSRSLAERIRHTPGTGYLLRGLIALEESDEPSPAQRPDVDARPVEGRETETPCVLGTASDLAEIVRREGIAELFVADQSLTRDDVMDILAATEPLDLMVRVANAQLAIIPSRVALRADVHGGIPIVDFAPGRPGAGARAAKRVLDVVIASFFLVVLAPAAAVISCLVKWDSRGPVLFRQRRLTAGRRPFRCLKFRSMCADAESRRAALAHLNEKQGAMFKLRGDPRVTRVGRVLRRWSLDEAPQIVNVLLGDMSLVGPRPPTEDEVAEYAPRHFHRFSGKAGITGLWQTSGRHDIGFENMVLLDVYYLRNRSLVLDGRILLRTLSTVLRGSGAA